MEHAREELEIGRLTEADVEELEASEAAAFRELDEGDRERWGMGVYPFLKERDEGQ